MLTLRDVVKDVGGAVGAGVGCQLPTLGATTILLVAVPGDLLGQVVGVLLRALDVGDRELFEHLVVVPEPVPLDMEVLGTARRAVVGGQGETALVVFERFGKNRGGDLRRKVDGCGHFLEQTQERDERAKGERQSGVLGLKSREGDLRLKLGLPNDGTAAQLDDVAGAGAGGVDASVRFTLVEAGEVGVAEQLQLEVASGLEDHPLVGRSRKVAHDGLDGGRVGLFRVGAEAGGLADGEGDVGARVGRQVQKHADDGGVAPRFVHWFAIVVATESQLACWSCVGLARLETRGGDDLVDEPFLRELDGSLVLVALELDPEELFERSLPLELESHGPKSADEIVDQILAWGREDAIVHEHHHKQGGGDEEARINGTLGESKVGLEQRVKQVFEPKTRGDGNTVKGPLQAKTGPAGHRRSEATREVDPDRLVKRGLDEGAREVDGDGLPLEQDRQNEEETDGGPRDNGGERLEVSLLEIATDAVAAFPLLDCSVGRSLATESPRSGKDLGRRFARRDFFPAVDALELADLLDCRVDPTLALGRFARHCLLEAEQIRIGVVGLVRKREVWIGGD